MKKRLEEEEKSLTQSTLTEREDDLADPDFSD